MSADLRPAWAEINAEALCANYRILSSIAAPARVAAVVKADGYGHGAVEVSKVLFGAGCRDFAVAFVDEGVELRRAGIEGEILVLSEAPAEALEIAAQHDISVTIYSVQAAKLASTISSPTNPEMDRLRMHLKIDTGMYRVGVSPSEIDSIADAIGTGDLEGAWSHFAVADETSEESRRFTQLQIERFHIALRRLAEKGVWPRQVHISNTAGLLNYPDARFSKVRAGIGLYGYAPSQSCVGPELFPVLSLVTKVAFIKEVEAGERPSYGRARALTKRASIATIPIGYADGVPRALFSGDGEVLIGGRRYPLAGAVTMDQILVDLGENSDVSIGDRVVLIGQDDGDSVWADEWATRCRTITWEILCGISKRIPRRTVGAGHGN